MKNAGFQRGQGIRQPLRILENHGLISLCLGRTQGKLRMTKAEIIDAVYEKVGGISKKEAAEIVEATFDTMKDVLADGENIKISGFGKFDVRDKAERMGRDPQTGEPKPISARRVLTFKYSQVLRAALNKDEDGDSSDDDKPGA